MRFTDIFIRRPVLAVSISLLIIILGLQAISKLAVREYPKMTTTVITVTTAYPGADANLIQAFVTSKIEGSNNLSSPFIKLLFCNVCMIFQPYDQRFPIHNIRTYITFVTMHYKFQNLIVPFFFQFPISFLVLHKFVIMLTRFLCYVNIYFHLFYFLKK